MPPANDEPSASVREHLLEHGQDIYREAFNHNWQQYARPRQEEIADRVCLAAVKEAYLKVRNKGTTLSSSKGISLGVLCGSLSTAQTAGNGLAPNGSEFLRANMGAARSICICRGNHAGAKTANCSELLYDCAELMSIQEVDRRPSILGIAQGAGLAKKLRRRVKGKTVFLSLR